MALMSLACFLRERACDFLPLVRFVLLVLLSLELLPGGGASRIQRAIISARSVVMGYVQRFCK